MPLHAARLWLHPNVPGNRKLSGAQPIQMKIENGIGIYPDDTGPRLPVLGLRALTLNKLQVVLDTDRLMVDVRTLDWRTKLLRLLSRM